MTLSPMIKREDYELAELENANLRQILRSVLPHLPETQHKELALALNRPIEAGGVVPDGVEDAEAELGVLHALLGRLVAHLEKVLPPDGSPVKQPDDRWFADLDPLLNHARGYEAPDPVTISALREKR